MAIIDKTIVVQGSRVVLTGLQLFPQQDGSVVLVAAGAATDAAGEVVGLSSARGMLQPGDSLISTLFDFARKALRQENGLDDDSVRILKPLPNEKQAVGPSSDKEVQPEVTP